MPPAKTGPSPNLVRISARRQVGAKRRGSWLYRCEWDDGTWSWESSQSSYEDPVFVEYLQLNPE